ncbi:MAG: hypothetical protein KAS84_06295, partial [Anaerolineales bacterium]|nr:hypothetical protein [Anaerolineales bacterium]
MVCGKRINVRKSLFVVTSLSFTSIVDSFLCLGLETPLLTEEVMRIIDHTYLLIKPQIAEDLTV